jgi:hypothetical protein
MILIGTMLLSASASAQKSTPSPQKRYCNPLVMGQSPTKRLSVIYEYQGAFHVPGQYTNTLMPSPTTHINAGHNLRIQYGKNLIMKPKFYMTFNAGYWFTGYKVDFQVGVPTPNTFAKLLDQRYFHGFSASTNMFKPLNSKNFLLVNLTVEAAGNGLALREFSGDNLLAGGAVIYGWKKGMQRMWGLGVFRGYRLGRVIHVPALLYNESFNKKWGVDALLPARAQVRYNRSAKQIWTAGYDLDGTQYALRTNGGAFDGQFFQRGEIRPRIGFERQLGKYGAFTMNGGVRFNGRFDISSDYAGKQTVLENNPKAGLFVNAGFHVTNFPKKKKK